MACSNCNNEPYQPCYCSCDTTTQFCNNPQCEEIIDAQCVIYTGEDLPDADIHYGERLDDIIIKLSTITAAQIEQMLTTITGDVDLMYLFCSIVAECENSPYPPTTTTTSTTSTSTTTIEPTTTTSTSTTSTTTAVPTTTTSTTTVPGTTTTTTSTSTSTTTAAPTTTTTSTSTSTTTAAPTTTTTTTTTSTTTAAPTTTTTSTSTSTTTAAPIGITGTFNSIGAKTYSITLDESISCELEITVNGLGIPSNSPFSNLVTIPPGGTTSGTVNSGLGGADVIDCIETPGAADPWVIAVTCGPQQYLITLSLGTYEPCPL